MSGDHNTYANWEPRHERLYKDGVLIRHRIQRTPNGEWEDYVPEEPPSVKKPQPKAFPNVTGQQGMDLRDYFAAKAMQGICAGRDEAGVLVHHGYKWIASESYQIADAMMKVREE
jgi:hypothetical protein